MLTVVLSVGAGNEDTAGHTLSLVGDGSEMMAQMERRAEAQALRANKAEEVAAPAAPEPMLSDVSVMWISSDDGVVARLNVIPCTDSSVAAMLSIVPTVQHDTLGAWAASSFPLLQDGKVPVFELDDAQRFSLPLAAVVYFCVEEPLPEAAPVRPAQDEMLNCTVASTGAAKDRTARVASASVAALGLDRIMPVSKAPARGRRPLTSGQAMLHIVLLEMEWDRSLTLRCAT